MAFFLHFFTPRAKVIEEPISRFIVGVDMEKGSCVLCPQGTEANVHIRTHSGGFPFSYLKCRGCGLVFLSPRPDGKEALQFYEQDYYGENPQKFRSGLEALRLFFAWNRMRRVRKFFPSSGKALDIGCGEGTFLRLLQKEGWECQGTELTAESASRASRLGISVSVGQPDEKRFPPHSFDLITLWQVLEHLPEPMKTLRIATHLLKKGGILAISTPNIDSLQAEVGRDQWFHLDPPRHLYLYSPRTLEQMIGPLGFSLLKLHHFSLEQNPYGWLQSLLNLRGLPENSLYRILKNTPNLPKEHLTVSQRGKAILLAASLLPHCLFLSLIMARLQRGGTFEAYFRLEEVKD
jgi:2-polyprenyl-3-methyl-5-hydroxy-6-metoxy-1,4-benzoquinol methylase